MLTGIISSGLVSNGRCDGSKYTLSTNVAVYLDWIKQIVKPTSKLPEGVTMLSMNCKFSYGEEMYEAEATFRDIRHDNFKVNRILGNHLGQVHTNDDVHTIKIVNSTGEHFPFGIGDFFKNAKCFYIIASKVKCVKRKMFKNMKQFEKVVALNNRKLTNVEENSLYDLPNLSELRLDYNAIKKLHKKLTAITSKSLRLSCSTIVRS